LKTNIAKYGGGSILDDAIAIHDVLEKIITPNTDDLIGYMTLYFKPKYLQAELEPEEEDLQISARKTPQVQR